MMTTSVSEMSQVMSVDFFSSRDLPINSLQLNSKLDELDRLTESEYDSNKAVNIFQYFDKIYTLCYGTSTFPALIDTIIQKKYASMYQIEI